MVAKFAIVIIVKNNPRNNIYYDKNNVSMEILHQILIVIV